MVHQYKGLKYQEGIFREVSDILTVEEAIQISINGESYTVTMRTPGHDAELVRGLLFSEDIFDSRDRPFSMEITTRNKSGVITGVNLNIPEDQLGPGYINSRNILSVSSCGICGKRELDDLSVRGNPLEHELQLDIGLLQSMFRQMSAEQDTFKQSGGSHASAAFTIGGELLAIKEDIGRHNAVDKVIGELIQNATLADAKCLLVSGRVSYEIVTKAFMAKIPYLASVSAPSTLAVDYSEQLGISLLSFCREDKATCYSHVDKIKTRTVLNK